MMEIGFVHGVSNPCVRWLIFHRLRELAALAPQARYRRPLRGRTFKAGDSLWPQLIKVVSVSEGTVSEALSGYVKS